MNRLNKMLLSCLLVVGVLLGLRLMQFIASIEASVTLASARLAGTSANLDSTLHNAEALLASLRSTAEAVRRSSTSQLGYYEAIGRRSSLVLAETALLVRHADRELTRLAQSTDLLLGQSRASVGVAAAQIELASLAASEALQAATRLTTAAEGKLQEPRVAETIENLTVASGHLARSAAASEDTLNSLRAIVSPDRKGFWRRLLEAFIPRPASPAAAR